MFLVSQLSIFKRKIILAISIPFVFLGQLMAYQYSNLLMDKGEMNESKYWDIFLRTDLASINKNKIQKILKENPIYKMELMDFEDFENDSGISSIGFHSSKSSIVGKNNIYSKGFSFPVRNLELDDSFYLIIECNVKTSEDASNLGLVVSLFEKEDCKYWFNVYKNQFNEESDGWTKMTEVVEIDKTWFNENSILKIFTTTEKGSNLVDNLKYTIVKKKI
jgi:hypothetical protein